MRNIVIPIDDRVNAGQLVEALKSSRSKIGDEYMAGLGLQRCTCPPSPSMEVCRFCRENVSLMEAIWVALENARVGY